MTLAELTGMLPRWVALEGSGEPRPTCRQWLRLRPTQPNAATKQCRLGVTRPFISKKAPNLYFCEIASMFKFK